MTDAPDTAAVQPAEGTYSEHVNHCGCRGVPEGQHTPGCKNYDSAKNKQALYCSSCGYHTATSNGHCGLCGAVKR